MARERACGLWTRLPLELLPVVHAMSGEGAVPVHLLERDLQCDLSPHGDGRHHAFVEYSEEHEVGIWAVWRTGSVPCLVYPLPDCEIGNGLPAGDDDACTLFQGHPRFHSWELYDPGVEAVREQVDEEIRSRAAARLRVVETTLGSDHAPADRKPVPE